MERALALLTASATFLSAGCAARSTLPLDPSVAASHEDRARPHLLAATMTGPAPQAAVAPGAAAPAPDPAFAEIPPRADHTSSAMPRAFGWFSVGVGTLATGAAIATSLMMLHQKSLRDEGCDAQKICSQDGLNANSQLNALAPWNVATWVVAGAGLGVGTILLVTHPADRAKQTALVVAPSGSGASISLWSAF